MAVVWWRHHPGCSRCNNSYQLVEWVVSSIGTSLHRINHPRIVEMTWKTCLVNEVRLRLWNCVRDKGSGVKKRALFLLCALYVNVRDQLGIYVNSNNYVLLQQSCPCGLTVNDLINAVSQIYASYLINAPSTLIKLYWTSLSNKRPLWKLLLSTRN